MFIVSERLTIDARSKTCSCFCEFDVASFSELCHQQLGINPEPALRGSVVKRKAEFLAGRYAATKALELLGHAPEPIHIGPHRAPVWPDYVMGSITHTTSQAVCTVSLHAHNNLVGIDLEQHVSAKTAMDIRSNVIVGSEYDFIRPLELPFEIGFTLLFSAKESVFKALYPHVGSYFDFDAVELTGLCTQRKSFTVRLRKTLSDRVSKGLVVSGIFSITESTVFTQILGRLNTST